MTEPIALGVGLAGTGLVALAISVIQLRSPTFWLEFAWHIPPGPNPGSQEVATRVLGAAFVCVGLAATVGGAFVVSTVLRRDATRRRSRTRTASRRQDLIRSRPESAP